MSQSFNVLITKLQAGDESAAVAILERYTGRLIGLARKRLGPGIRSKLDPDDVLQSVYRSFFLRHRKGKFQLKDWDNLWSLLATITLRKCGHRIEWFYADRRDIRIGFIFGKFNRLTSLTRSTRVGDQCR